MQTDKVSKYRTGDTVDLTYLHSRPVRALDKTTFEITDLRSGSCFGGTVRNGKPEHERPAYYHISDFLEDLSIEGNGDGRCLVVEEGELFRKLHRGLKDMRQADEVWNSRYTGVLEARKNPKADT